MIREIVSLIDKYDFDSVKITTYEAYVTVVIQKGIFNQSFNLTRELIFGEDKYYEYAEETYLQTVKEKINEFLNVEEKFRNSFELPPKQLEG